MNKNDIEDCHRLEKGGSEEHNCRILQCPTQEFFGHTVGNIFSNSQSAPMVGTEGQEKFEILPFQNAGKCIIQDAIHCFLRWRETKKNKMFNNNSLESFVYPSQPLLGNRLLLIFVTYFVICKHDKFDRHLFLKTINLDISKVCILFLHIT